MRTMKITLLLVCVMSMSLFAEIKEFSKLNQQWWKISICHMRQTYRDSIQNEIDKANKTLAYIDWKFVQTMENRENPYILGLVKTILYGYGTSPLVGQVVESNSKQERLPSPPKSMKPYCIDKKHVAKLSSFLVHAASKRFNEKELGLIAERTNMSVKDIRELNKVTPTTVNKLVQCMSYPAHLKNKRYKDWDAVGELYCDVLRNLNAVLTAMRAYQ